MSILLEVCRNYLSRLLDWKTKLLTAYRIFELKLSLTKLKR